MGALKILLLGSPQIERQGKPVAFDTRKATAILAYLAVTAQPHTRESLAALLWPEYDAQRAFANLRRTLWSLNRGLGKQWLEVGSDTVTLRRDKGLTIDIDAFHEQLEKCRSHGHALADTCDQCIAALTAAVALYRGDFMAGFTLRDSPPFDEWQFFQAETLRGELSSALERLAHCHTFRGDLELAIQFGRRWLAVDPLHEPAHRELMRLYAWSGQRAAAIRQYQECERILQQELDSPPQVQTTQLYELIRRDELPLPESLVPPSDAVERPRPAARPRHNLPPQPTPFIGRDNALREIKGLLEDSECRLLTLVGPGGVGKTRLAIEAARAEVDAFPQGVWFVPLASLEAPEFIVPAIGEALPFSFFQREGEEPKQQLLNYLSEKEALLLLDNFESLLAGTHLLSDILGHAPGVKLMVTSRQRLNVQDEWVFEVQGLRYPEQAEPDSLDAYSALQLFVDRARRVDASFAPQAALPAISRICQLVEGMPLAIELAAAWVRLLSCDEIAQEIERSLDFLATSMRDVPQRHRSLRAVFDHSWQLLAEDEIGAVRHLSVFRGGFDREAAHQVAGADLACLSALVDKSLLQREASGQYSMHELLRQYAAQKLEQVAQDKVRAQDAHGAYFITFLEQRHGDLHSSRQREALDEIAAQIDNIRAAWSWATQRGKASEIRRSAFSLFRYYHAKFQPQEGREAFARAVAALSPDAPYPAERALDAALARGMCLAYEGVCASFLYQTEEAEGLLRQSLEVLRPLGPRIELAQANAFAVWVGAIEDLTEAEALLREGMAIQKAADDRWGLCVSLRMLGVCAYLGGRTAEAKQYLHQSLAISRRLGNRWEMASALNELGEIAQHHEGNRREAIRFYQESLEISREIGDRWAEQLLLDYIGYISRELGEYDEARRLHLQSLDVAREIGDPLGVAGSLDNLGLVYRDLDDLDEAEQHFEQALAIRSRLTHYWSIAVSYDHLADVALARGDYERASHFCQSSMDVEGGLAKWGLVTSYQRMGELCLALGQTEKARERFWDALVDAMQARHISAALDVLVGAARLASETGQREKAAEWLAFVAQHPASSLQLRKRSQELLADLESEIGAEEAARARARAQGQNVRDIAKQALALMRPT